MKALITLLLILGIALPGLVEEWWFWLRVTGTANNPTSLTWLINGALALQLTLVPEPWRRAL